MPERDHDIILFGATGFTGALTAEYLAQHAGDGLRWALAGRNRAKLEALCERLGIDVPLLHADVGDEASLRTVAESRACRHHHRRPVRRLRRAARRRVRCGGHRLRRPDGRARVRRPDVRAPPRGGQRSGARIVHACGFDSIPHDLGVLFTVEQLPEGRAAERPRVRARGREAVRRHLPLGDERVQPRARDAAGPQGAPRRRGRRQRPSARSPAKPHRELGYWAVPMPTIDPQVIAALGARPGALRPRLHATGTTPASSGCRSRSEASPAQRRLFARRRCRRSASCCWAA